MLLAVGQQFKLSVMTASLLGMGWAISNAEWNEPDLSVVEVVRDESDEFSANIIAKGEGAVMVKCTFTIDEGNGTVRQQDAAAEVGVIHAEGCMALEAGAVTMAGV